MPVLWVLFEWLRSWVLTGFPWILSGYPMIETVISGYAPMVGIYGLSFLVILISALFVIRIKLLFAISSVVLLFVGGFLLNQIRAINLFLWSR